VIGPRFVTIRRHEFAIFLLKQSRNEDVSMYKSICIGLAGLIVAGCMSSTSPTPTHRWASTSDADRVQYQNDHAKCQAAANVDSKRTELETGSAEFTAYRQCMNNRGYVLTAYND